MPPETLLICVASGGAMENAYEIENYPGFEKISGAELASKIIAQIKKLGVEMKNDKVTKIKKTETGFEVETEQAEKIPTKTVILTTGMERRKLGVPGEEELLGRGVSYCPTCDGRFFKDRIVAVIGGGDAGLASANLLADICPKVYIIEAEDKLRAEPYWQDKIKARKNVEIILSTKTTKINGKEVVESLSLQSPTAQKDLKVDGVFIEIGSTPNATLAKNLGIKLDEQGFIVIDPGGATNLKGVWAAGDITTGSEQFWQILPSMAEGAIAAHSVYKFLK